MARCKECKHWKWHSRKDEPEPMHARSFHYCDVMFAEDWLDRQKRREACGRYGLFEQK